MDEKAIIVRVLPDSHENKTKKDKDNEYFTTCSGLSPAEVTVMFIGNEIVSVDFNGRPNHPHGSGGAHKAHKISVDKIKKDIKDEYEGQSVDKIKVTIPNISFFKDLEESDIEQRNYINMRKEIAKKIAKEFKNQCKDPSNMYESSSIHNAFLNHLSQILKNRGKHEKYPFSITINEKYHDICAEKYPELFDSTEDTLHISDSKTLEQIKTDCQVDKPENNPEIKNKPSAYDYLVSEEKNKSDNSGIRLDFS